MSQPTALELALNAPRAYHDYRLKSYIDDPKELFVEARIIERIPHPKLTKFLAYATNLAQEIEIVFFKTTPFHEKLFHPGATLYLAGRAQRFGRWQLTQPKRIANYKVGRIYAEYKTSMRGDHYEALKERILTRKNLLAEGLPEDVVEALLTIHYPDEAFYKEFRRRGEFWGKYLEALKFAEAFGYLRKLSKKRVRRKAKASCKKSLQPFLDHLPFTLTDDQLKALADIAADLASNVAAKRVVVGDVGSGKSVVMFGAAWLAHPRRSILMAPTTILATQLFEEAKRLLPPDVKVGLVVSGRSYTKEELERYHLLVGTHALLYQDLPDACLVMVDEQHRFGTEQRERLKKLVESKEGAPHFLQFSATPIPRTKAMIDSALVDFSFIRQTPFKKNITTEVIGKDDFKRLLAHIKAETDAGRQVLIVYPLVEESEAYGYKSLEEAAAFWQKHFDGVYVTHGKDKDKDEVLKEFCERGKILLATTVVEVGISLPKLSTIVVVGAENLGLATLHQLRGRVSRTGLEGYCYLYTHDPANERLQAFARTSSGFEIAELDLKFRKSGDILQGKEQSGKAFRWLSMAEDAKILERVKQRLAELAGAQ
jgi:ATP-dependent DNA helicase RecG